MLLTIMYQTPESLNLSSHDEIPHGPWTTEWHTVIVSPCAEQWHRGEKVYQSISAFCGPGCNAGCTVE